MKSQVLSGWFCLSLLTGCDCVYTYRFEVRNATSASIEVSFSANDKDSVATIEGEIAVVLLMTEGRVRGCLGDEPNGGIPEEEVADLIDAVRVRKADGSFSSRDYLSNDAWFYDNGIYRAYVTDAEFD